jgi:hypothetical protein
LDYPALANIVLKILLLFQTTHECEAGFSSLLQIKTKHRNRLNEKDVLRYALSPTIPRIKKLAAEKETQPSHSLFMLLRCDYVSIHPPGDI